MALHTNSEVTFHASDLKLESGFERLKQQALHWVFEGYPVGDYYEAALPGRNAFCMRDISHQCTGGEVLGLSSHNKNMFLKFAQSISDDTDWCPHWEIDRWNRPCPVDYTNNQDFWYNLPANFDMLHACWRMYQWTGDQDYLNHPDLDYYYAQSMEAYIQRWDSNGDGLPDGGRRLLSGYSDRRGVPGYNESQTFWNTLQTATDMVAAMARAHLSYGKICSLLGRTEQEAIYQKRGLTLLARLNRDFYREDLGFAEGLDFDGKLLHHGSRYVANGSLLYWDAVPDQDRREKMLNIYAAGMEDAIIELLSHYPEIQWRYGRDREAMASLWKLLNPNLFRKEYPEASYCTIGAIATGMMGIAPNAAMNTVRTVSGLVDTQWAQLRYVPVLGGKISVYHKAHHASAFTYEGNHPIIWRACFHGDGMIEIDGATATTMKSVCAFTGRPYIYVDIPVNSGQTISVCKQEGRRI